MDEPLLPLIPEHVLLPLDGSAFSAAALPTARALAARFGAELSTISVADDEEDATRLRRHAEETLADGPSGGGVEVAIGDDPAQTIAERRRALGSCVVCMSTKGRGRIAGALLGSVARAVLTQSNVPVVAVGPQADRPGALVGRPRRRPASWPEPLSVRHLVACVDGSQASEAVLPEAARWATLLEMRLSILTVAEETVVAGGGPAPNRFGPPDPRAYVDGLADRWAEVVPGARPEVVADPIGVASGVRSYLAAEPSGLVAVTTHARSGLERVRMGAAAAEIVSTSTAPSLVVPVLEA